jgi:hypothetical protein
MLLRRGAAIALIASLPILVAVVLARVSLGGSPATAIPYVSDEVAYWTQIAAFQVAGFNGGYTTVDEQPARAAFSRFGPQGPAFAVLYGAVARVTGWRYQSGPLFGAVAFLLGASLWLAIAKPNRLLAALLCATFWPVVLAAPNTMQESLHFAMGAVLAALTAMVLGDQPVPRWRVWLTWATVAVAALVRPTWALLAVGLAWQLSTKRGSRVGAEGVIAGVAVTCVLYLTFAFLAAPYGGNSVGLEMIQSGVIQGSLNLLRGFWAGGGHWLLDDAEPLERFYRIELLGVAILTAVSAVTGREASTRRVMAAMAVTLWITIAATLALQNIGGWRDYRATAPVLLMAVLAAAGTRQRWSWGVVAVHLAATPLAVATFKDFQAPRWEREAPAAAIERFAESVRGYLHYDPSLTGWGNTLLIGVNRYDYPLMGLPRGMGISVTFDWTKLPAPAKSRYLVLTEPDVRAISGRMRVRKLADTPLGGLYENEEWAR